MTTADTPATRRPADDVVDWAEAAVVTSFDAPRRRAARSARANGHANGRVLSADGEASGSHGDRLAPQDIDAEQSVLGSILIDDGALERVASILDPASFYRATHGLIFAAMLEVHASETPIDLVTLGDALRRREQLEEVGGPAYLTSIMAAVPTAANVEHYARIVSSKALSRRAIADAGRLAAIGYEDSNDPDELLARTRALTDGIHAAWRPSGAIADRLGARWLSEIRTDAPAEPLVGRLDPAGHTILYGSGGAGKGTLASSWILGLVYAGHRVLIVDYENHPDEWARRIHGLGGAEVLGEIRHVAPLTASWRGRRGPLWDQATDLRTLAEDFGATVAVIDSIVPACGATDPLKPEAAAQYAGALEYLGRPVLSLAHVTKAESLTYPFGSAFWHNLARMTWSLKRDGAGALLANRKANNYARVGPTLVTVTWDGGSPREVWERPHSEVLSRRIATVLGDGNAMSVAKICDALNVDLEEDDEPVKSDTVGRTLRRGQTGSRPVFKKHGADRWTLA